MTLCYNSLLLNHQRYQKNELIQLCREKLNTIDIPDWEINLYLFIQKWLDDTNTLMVKTSGSTGKAKTIEVSKQAMVQSAQMTGQYFQLQPEQNALLCLPTIHIAGQMMVVRAFVLGLNLISIKPNAISLDSLGNQTIDFAAMLPLQVHKLLFTESSSQAKLEPIKRLLIGGASISPKLLNAIQHLKTAVYQSYGMTETLSHIAIRRLNSPQEPFYKILNGVQIEQDSRGCLIIHAPSLDIDKLVSNDLVKLHSETAFELLGRFDNVINSGGIKFNPEQLEAKLETIISTRRFFISSVNDDKLGQKLVLLIEGSPYTRLELEKIDSQIRTILDKYQRPKAIFFIKQFKETQTGKIQRDETGFEIKKTCYIELRE